MARCGMALIAVVGMLGGSATPATAQAPEVRWVLPPPLAIQGGQQFVVQWELVNFVGPLTDNAVAWGITSLLGQTPSQLGGNCIYTTVVDVPVVPRSGTLFYAVFAQSATEFAFADPMPVLLTPQPAACTYVPTEPGSFWMYEKTGLSPDPWTRTVGPGYRILGCARPRSFEDTWRDTSSIERFEFYLEATVDGVFYYGEYDLAGVPPTAYLVEPPIQLMEAELIVGTIVNSAGILTITPVGGPSASLPYTATATVVGFEPVAVPAGTFDTVKIHLSIISGGGFDASTDIWFAPGVGIVQELNMDVVPSETDVLVYTTLPRP